MERDPFETEQIKSTLIRLAKRMIDLKNELSEISQQENKFFKTEEGISIRYFFKLAFKYFKQELQAKKFEKNFDPDLFEYFLSISHFQNYEKNKTEREQRISNHQIRNANDGVYQISNQEDCNIIQ